MRLLLLILQLDVKGTFGSVESPFWATNKEEIGALYQKLPKKEFFKELILVHSSNNETKRIMITLKLADKLDISDP